MYIRRISTDTLLSRKYLQIPVGILLYFDIHDRFVCIESLGRRFRGTDAHFGDFALKAM